MVFLSVFGLFARKVPVARLKRYQNAITVVSKNSHCA